MVVTAVRLGPAALLALFVLLALIGASLPATVASAQDTRLIAAVDRSTIRENESFSYILHAEGRISGRPDLSALERDFDVVDSPRSSTRIQILNGQQSQVTEWVYQLMPREAGRYELPAVEVGGVVSNTVSLEVLPALTEASADADIFLEVELDRSSSYVQSQVIYTIRLFVGIGMGRATLTPPLVQGGEAIVEKLSDDSEYQTVRGDRNYYVRERRFAIFPQQAGTLTIGPATLEAMVIPNGGFSRVQRLRSEAVSLEVMPAVAPPAAYPDAVWLPASNLSIEQEWSDSSAEFKQGVPRTRMLTVVADGLLETQLPELRIGSADGLRQYPDQPTLSREVSADGITALRVERFAVVAQRDGSIELPAIEVPWWNVEAGRWEIARLEAESIDVLPSDEEPVSAAPEPEPTEIVRAEPPAPNVWPWISAALALGWAATIAAWLLTARTTSRRGSRAPRASRPPSGRSLLKQLKAACRVDDAERTRELLLDWAGLQFPEAPPGSLGALADRLDGPIVAEIRSLEAALYGRSGGSWSGQRLAELIRSTQLVRRSGGDGGDDDPLMPLYR